MDTIFILNISVIPAWLLLAFLPKHKITETLIYSYAYPIVLAVAYTVCIGYGMFFVEGEPGGGMGSLEQLRISFTNDWILSGAWLHYLCFDLFVGIWIVKDSQKRGINQWLLLPVLFFTLMFGPFGFLLYVGLRKVVENKS